jgi:3-oxoacyl-[acyl-carrier-protein] synthase II
MNAEILTAANDASAVLVTGMGVASAAGSCPAALWDNVALGRSPAVTYADARVPDSPPIPACVVPGPGADSVPLRRSHKMDRCVQLALEAAGQAVADADLPSRGPAAAALGIVAGTSRGPMGKWTEMLDMTRTSRRPLPPTLAANSTLACVSGALAMAFEAAGPCLTISATCASGAYAIILGAQQILLGAAEVVLVGGTDAPLQDAIIRQVLSTGILGSHADPRRACRPFDVSRDGTLLGEGAAFLILESRASARRRGARVHAELAGWALGSDPSHCTSPREDGEGLLQTMQRALARARLGAEDIDYINAHGTGTPVNDRVEVVSMARLLGGRLGAVPCSSTKPITGHCLGASAALEAVISILALQHQCVPPTTNCDDLDPALNIDAVQAAARPASLRVVMSNSLGFWGKNASLIFTRPGAS